MLAVTMSMASGAWSQRPTPGYNPKTRTLDETVRVSLEFAGGYNVAQGVSRTTQTRGWSFLSGAGLNLNRYIGGLGEFAFDRFAVPAPVGGGYGDYRAHIWSVGGAGVFRYFATEHWGGYVIAGGGLYHKRIVLSAQCGRGTGYCASGVAGTVVEDQAPGFNAGAGFAWRVSDNSNAKAFFEARYVRTGDLPNGYFRQGVAQREPLTYIPVRSGIRW